MEEKPGSEERKFKRIDVSFSVSYQVNAPLAVRMSIGNREFEAEASDLSEGGMAIVSKYTSDYAIPTFTIVTVKFTMLDDAVNKIEERYKSTEIKGEVRSSLYLKETKVYRLGISFLDLSPEQRGFLANLVKISSQKGGKDI
ncbi:MAG: hypothetical protein A3K83_02525 [Omnitrophica WOR_2 bacterium RBG_13_44_8b]|nr:MAG: hypothetical protein A3K83_02525 [Omnitrophica WOR_2 bacterium RBG_13_44_8b]